MLQDKKVLRLGGIEALRAVAAMMIVMFHMVELPKLNIPEYLNVIRTHFGLGVPLFYTLSGFVLAYGYGDSLTGRPSIVRFYLRRLFRIAPLFYFMLAVQLILGWLKWGRTDVPITDILLNMLFTFGLIPGKHESLVMAGWSIGVEMIFYVLFPIVSALIAGVLSGAIAFIVSAFLSAITYTTMQQAGLGSFAYMNLITQLPFFLAGVLGYRIWQSSQFNTSVRYGAFLLGLAITASIVVIKIPGVYKALASVRAFSLERNIWAIIFLLVVLSVCYWPNRLIVNRGTTNLGRISFSLYLFHPLIIVLLYQLFNFYNRIGEALGAGGIGFVVCAAVTGGLLSFVSMISFRLIEKPGIDLGRRFSKRFQ